MLTEARPHVLYTIPVGQNPTGVVSSLCFDFEISINLRLRPLQPREKKKYMMSAWSMVSTEVI